MGIHDNPTGGGLLRCDVSKNLTMDRAKQVCIAAEISQQMKQLSISDDVSTEQTTAIVEIIRGATRA